MRCSVAVLATLLIAVQADAKVTRYLTGNASDALPVTDYPLLAGPALNLGGGGTDVDAALQRMVNLARGCDGCPTTVDVVILRVTGSSGYNDYIYAMDGVDSVETLVITRRADADSAAVEATVKNAEVVFFAGGDQCNYTTVFKGTKLDAAVESVYARGGAVGGTSAGMAIMGENIYDACGGSATSAGVLANPYDRAATFSYGFFAWPVLQDVLTDQHFVARDRMGRLLGFLARQLKDARENVADGSGAWGLAADEATSIIVDRNGMATVMGNGRAYLIHADHNIGVGDTVAAKKPLTYRDYRVWSFTPGQSFGLAPGNRPTTGSYDLDVVNGVITPVNPY